MLAQPFSGQVIEKQETGNRLTAVAILIGLLVGGLFNWVWGGLPGLASLAVWPLGVAIGLIGVALVNGRRTGETPWGMALVGQAIGVLAVGLIFVTTL
jgi:hypothetical protein